MPICSKVDQLHKASLEFRMLRMSGFDVLPSKELILKPIFNIFFIQYFIFTQILCRELLLVLE